MIIEQAPRILNNFLTSYTLQESTELLNQVFDHVTKGTHFAALSDGSKEQILDFLEALEELLPAVHEVHNQQ